MARTAAAAVPGREVLEQAGLAKAPGRVAGRREQTGEQLAGAMDDLDRALREGFPEVAEVFIDVTPRS